MRTRMRQPAEWEAHDSCWLAWPSHAELWRSQLREVQSTVTQLCQAIASSECVELLVRNDADRLLATAALENASARLHSATYGDIWLRDTGPLFVHREGTLTALRYRFNGWGDKYNLVGDQDVGEQIATIAEIGLERRELILEGGAIDVDGRGTGLTTRQCLLNENRNPGVSEKDYARDLGQDLGIEKLIWLDEGLVNDHTDGHVDTLARFVADGVVTCMLPDTPHDPNTRALEAAHHVLSGACDAQGRKLDVVPMPSPGAVLGDSDELLPASYANFYIANSSVVVPVYGVRADERALRVIENLFPDRDVIPVDAKALLRGGGAVHCITQQQPARIQESP